MHPAGNSSVLQTGVPLKDAALAVVLLHGRGGTAEDILGLAGALNLAEVAYLAPQAKNNTWYPQSFMAAREANEPYLSSALNTVADLVRFLEQAGLPSNRVVIGGFSQGACLSSEFVATQPARYGGLIAFTGGLIGPPGSVGQRAAALVGNELGGMPALLSSGDPDPHVPWKRVEESADILRAMGAEVTTKHCPGRPHTVTAEELDLARSLLLKAKGL